jgi:hypothetical protein
MQLISGVAPALKDFAVERVAKARVTMGRMETYTVVLFLCFDWDRPRIERKCWRLVELDWLAWI